MSTRHVLVPAMLWAVAMFAAAAFDAPRLLSLILLPVLAAASLLAVDAGACRQRRAFP